ncbi:hypothetical protein F5B22DRAFT_641011 [Xylaria bambusicola]|uniref:uncharacterized protein n=1 Tax=Xylaria bambusicola TaxID=326684 RepID=UPI0020088018|nr:uncharacterized protein F5B22DRAFT_641011 [Xylaria bambusicola]KAI0528037.1 hypothetical protein F5B22DRAFT_641011 [Xylaria bambusicola]
MSLERRHEGRTHHRQESHTKLYMTIYVFRGAPDFHYKRHVLIYFQSPANEFYETVHVVRDDKKSPWRVDRVHHKVDWAMTVLYLFHCDGGALWVPSGQELAPANIMASVSTENKEEDKGWNCQHFLLEGLKQLVDAGYQTQEWYNWVENALMNLLLDGACD